MKDKLILIVEDNPDHLELTVLTLRGQGVTAEIIKDGLLKLGLITSKENNEFRTWFMHGTSHWIGMNVHDVGDYRTPLAAGMVLTVEPGLYFQPDDLTVPVGYRGIGIRIEDDVLVTEKGMKNLSAGIPRDPDAVEAWVKKFRAT